MIEFAGRNCYNSMDAITDDSYSGFILRAIERDHGSILEFMNITLDMVTSREVMTQWVRHRIASHAIRSQRYVMEYGDDGVHFIRPQFSVKKGEDTADDLAGMYRTWEEACRASESYYKEMLLHGAKKDDARKVLNNSVATRMITCINARELRHILNLRLSAAAYPEMRRLAQLILKEVSVIPVLFDDFIEKERR
jgi:flavin-dependent thymidylate synthase